MKTLSYKDKDGKIQQIGVLNITSPTVSQTLGQSEKEVVSQKAITDKFNSVESKLSNIENKTKNDWNASSTQDGYIANKPPILGGFVLIDSSNSPTTLAINDKQSFVIQGGKGIEIDQYSTNGYGIRIDSTANSLDNLHVTGGLALVDSVGGSKWLSIELDTTLFKVVTGTSLPNEPEENDKNKIHLLKLSSSENNNSYAEYLWINVGTDAIPNWKWEKLGEATLDLSGYAKADRVEALEKWKNDAVVLLPNYGSGETNVFANKDRVQLGLAPYNIGTKIWNSSGTSVAHVNFPSATPERAGVMSAQDKQDLDDIKPVTMDVLIGLGKDYSIQILNDDLEDSIENVYENLNRILYNPSLLTFKFVVIQSTLEEDENGDSLFGNVMDPIAAVAETVTISGDTAKFYTSIGNKNLIITLRPNSIKAEFDKKSIGTTESVWEEGTGENSVQIPGSTASGNYSVSEGMGMAISDYSHAEGSSTAGIEDYDFEEQQTIIKGNYAHAEGDSSFAQGEASHAEGFYTRANGEYSHSEGSNTEASGSCSHAGGAYSVADGNYSFSHGKHTESWCLNETSFGRHNISIFGSGLENVGSEENPILGQTFGSNENTLFTIGNGYESVKSGDAGVAWQDNDSIGQTYNKIKHNAFEIRQSGDIYISDTLSNGAYYEKPMLHLQGELKTNWEANPGEPGYIMNRPFYEGYDWNEINITSSIVGAGNALGADICDNSYHLIALKYNASSKVYESENFSTTFNADINTEFLVKKTGDNTMFSPKEFVCNLKTDSTGKYLEYQQSSQSIKIYENKVIINESYDTDSSIQYIAIGLLIYRKDNVFKKLDKKFLPDDIGGDSIVSIQGNIYTTSTGTTLGDITATTTRYLYLDLDNALKLYNFISEDSSGKSLRLKFNTSSANKSPEVSVNIEGTATNQIAFIYNGYRILGSALSSKPTAAIRITLTINLLSTSNGPTVSASSSSNPYRLIGYSSSTQQYYSNTTAINGGPYMTGTGELGAKDIRAINSMSVEGILINSYYDFTENTIGATVKNLPVDRKIIFTVAQTDSEFSLAQDMVPGQELHIIIYGGKTNSDVIIAIPSTLFEMSVMFNGKNESQTISIPQHCTAELNILRLHNIYHIRSIV